MSKTQRKTREMDPERESNTHTDAERENTLVREKPRGKRTQRKRKTE